MPLIYEPSGKAREYSPLALNHYNGCDHKCEYCYVKNIIADSQNPKPKKDIITLLEKELKNKPINDQVLLSFMGDPYCNLDLTLGLTTQVLQVLLKHNVPVAILTKGGTHIYRDLNLLKQFKTIKIGATLTFDNDKDSQRVEPGAALPDNRLEMLRVMKEHGFKTWVSMEPVLDPVQSLNMIKKSLPFVDQYKVGRWNHDTRANAINWKQFGESAVKLLRDNGKEFYIKKDLAVFLTGLTKQETDYNYLSLKQKPIMKQEQTALF